VSSKEYHFRDFLGKKVLIVGEVGAGKTTLTVKLIQEACEAGLSRRMTILDLAPGTITSEGMKVSGKISDRIHLPNEIAYLTSDLIKAPRLEGSSREEVLRYADSNLRIFEEIFDKFKKTPTPILFVNDLSLYLHLGEAHRLKELLSEAVTVIVNAYEGNALKADFGSGISDRENVQLSQLKDWMNIVIRIKADGDRGR
jgi:GTPase SAR1 family protein